MVDIEELIRKVANHDPTIKIVDLDEFDNPTEEQMLRLLDALFRNRYVKEFKCFRYNNSGRRPRWMTQAVAERLADLFRVNTVIDNVKLPGLIGNDHFAVVAQGLYNNTMVETLDISFGGLVGRRGGDTIRDLLLHNGIIVEIDNRDLGVEGISSLATALADERCKLKTLRLRFCGIGDDGAQVLCNALKRNEVLEHLILDNNPLTFTGLQSVAEMLLVNTSIESIDLSGNNFDRDAPSSEAVRGCLVQALQDNHSLRRMNVQHCGRRLQQHLPMIQFFLTRNKMGTLVEGRGADPAPNNTDTNANGAAAVPAGFWPHVLVFCANRDCPEVKASLLFYVLSKRTNDVFAGHVLQQQKRMRRHGTHPIASAGDANAPKSSTSD